MKVIACGKCGYDMTSLAWGEAHCKLAGGLPCPECGHLVMTKLTHPECRGCGFDLVGLSGDQVCPECGLLVQETLKMPLLRDESSTTIDWVRRGVRLELIGLLGSVLVPIGIMLMALVESYVNIRWVNTLNQNVVMSIISVPLFVAALGGIIVASAMGNWGKILGVQANWLRFVAVASPPMIVLWFWLVEVIIRFIQLHSSMNWRTQDALRAGGLLIFVILSLLGWSWLIRAASSRCNSFVAWQTSRRVMFMLGLWICAGVIPFLSVVSWWLWGPERIGGMNLSSTMRMLQSLTMILLVGLFAALFMALLLRYATLDKYLRVEKMANKERAGRKE
jgi:hypothetical protein